MADATAQCVERGELQHAVGSGALSASAIVEMGAWLARTPAAAPGRLVIFDSTGVAVQDAKIAELALKAAPALAPLKNEPSAAGPAALQPCWRRAARWRLRDADRRGGPRCVAV